MSLKFEESEYVEEIILEIADYIEYLQVSNFKYYQEIVPFLNIRQIIKKEEVLFEYEEVI